MGEFGFIPGTQIHTFLWDKGTMQDIGTLGGPGGVPAGDCGIAPPNLIVGGSYISSSPNSWTGLPTLDPFIWNVVGKLGMRNLTC